MGLKDLFFLPNDSEKKDSAKPESKKPQVSDNEDNLSFPKSKEEKITTSPSKSKSNFEDDGDIFSMKPKASATEQPIVEETEPVPTSKNGTNPYMDEITSLYEDGFTKLNKEGVDFYEFYQSVKVGGIDNVAAYPMAFNMCKGMNPEFTKETAISDGEDYITSIDSAYQQYKTSGENKLNQAKTEKSDEEATLQSEVDELEGQIRQLTATLNTKKRELGSIGDKYKDKLEAISLKLEANKVVKTNLTNSITKVITNIKNNL